MLFCRSNPTTQFLLTSVLPKLQLQHAVQAQAQEDEEGHYDGGQPRQQDEPRPLRLGDRALQQPLHLVLLRARISSLSNRFKLTLVSCKIVKAGVKRLFQQPLHMVLLWGREMTTIDNQSE